MRSIMCQKAAVIPELPSETLDQLPSPSLLIEKGQMLANVERMRLALAHHHVDLRPHVKTCKSAPIARLMAEGWSGAVTVSTLREAEESFAAGFRDILYAVGITPQKLPEVERLTRAGADLSLILDSLEAAEMVAAYCRNRDLRLPILIEIDSDGHRAGVAPDDEETLISIGTVLHEKGAELRGVMTHGGGSYDVAGEAALARHAELERSGAVGAAASLRRAGLPCPVVSVGSTPTALHAKDLTGVTEVRAGVYVFFDLVMVGVGACGVGEVALSVLTRVIGHQRARGWIIVDAGWMALSRDRGTQRQAVDQGYGLVCDIEGKPIEDLVVISANQEHGIIAHRGGLLLDVERFPIGMPLRILPNHACATAAQHDNYHLVEAGAVEALLPRFRGW